MPASTTIAALHAVAAGMLMAMSWGCSISATELDEYWDTGSDVALTSADFDRVRLRIDVLPSVEAGDDLLAQSMWLDEQSDWQNLDLAMRPTVTISGSVAGFAANPYSITVPGVENVPVLSTVVLQEPGTIVSSVVQTERDGSFALRLPSGSDYLLSVLPEVATLPMRVEDGVEIRGNTDLGELRLDYGAPVYGTITSDGMPLSVSVRLVDAVTGVEGFATLTDAAGFYMLRAEPGEYLVQVEPLTGATMPIVQQPVTLDKDDGAWAPVDVGIIEPVLVRGVPRTSGGQTMSNAVVRLTATALDQAQGTMMVETETDQSGGFLIYALPGEWTLEIVPPADVADLTAPLEEALTIDSSEVNLGTLTLSEQITIERMIYDSDGLPAANVLATFTEQGFDHATYSAYTDADGFLTVSVPDVPLDVLLTPSEGEAAVTRRELLSPSVAAEDAWSLSDGVRLSGAVRRPGASGGISIVEVYDEDGIFYGSTLTDAEGAFDFRISP